MKSFKSFITEEDKVKKGKEVSVGKNTVKINPDSEELKEVAPPGAKAERQVKHIKKSYSKDGKLTDKERSIAYATAWKHANESAVPGKPAERLGAVTAIPQKERDAARERLLAKTKEIRNKKKIREEIEIEEGKQAFPLKKVEKKMDAVRKETGYSKPGNPAVPQVSPSEMSARNRLHKLSSAHAKAKRARQEADKASRSSTFYRDTHPTSQAKMKKSNESLSFSDFMEARRMDKEGVDRGDSGRAERADKAKASLAAAQKGKQTRLKAGITHLKHKAEREHEKNFPGSRQEPKEKGKKETPLETHNRRVNRQVDRVVKHGYTSKEKKHADAMAKHTSRFD